MTTEAPGVDRESRCHCVPGRCGWQEAWGRRPSAEGVEGFGWIWGCRVPWGHSCSVHMHLCVAGGRVWVGRSSLAGAWSLHRAWAHAVSGSLISARTSTLSHCGSPSAPEPPAAHQGWPGSPTQSPPTLSAGWDGGKHRKPSGRGRDASVLYPRFPPCAGSYRVQEGLATQPTMVCTGSRGPAAWQGPAWITAQVGREPVLQPTSPTHSGSG